MVFYFIKAGSCYKNLSSDGKCGELLANDVTNEECCSSFNGAGFGEVISNEAIFWIQAGMRKENCSPCKVSIHSREFYSKTDILTPKYLTHNNNNNTKTIIESCDNVKCSAGKRCIMKRGKPKCVCAPQCKAATATINNKNRKVGVNGEFTAFQLPEMRHYSVVRPPSEMQNDEPTLVNILKNLKSFKKMNQSTEAFNKSSGNSNDVARTIELKFRKKLMLNQKSNAFNLIPMNVDEFYLGNIVSFHTSLMQLK